MIQRWGDEDGREEKEGMEYEEGNWEIVLRDNNKGKEEKEGKMAYEGKDNEIRKERREDM